MGVFADTSALVRLYVEEAGPAIGWPPDAPLVIAQLTRVELPAAVWRKHRAGDLTANDARLLVADFEADYRGSGDASPRLATVRMTDDVVVVAGRLVARYPLTAGDAVQLASAVVARRADAAIDRLAAFDLRLRDAAATEGFALLPSGVAWER